MSAADPVAGPVRLQRPMPSYAPPEWDSAVWVGTVDESVLEHPESDLLHLDDAAGYRQARLLVRSGRRVRGFVEGRIVDGALAIEPLALQLWGIPRPSSTVESVQGPWFTVVICTRDRADQLRQALTSVLALDYPSFDVIVVDNASATGETRRLIEQEFADRVVLVTEPVPGLASARNAGLRSATGEYVAYTDDDVLVDAHWLSGLADGFARGDEVDCVTGLVPSGELRTPVQAYFDDRVSWSRNIVPRTFTLSAPPADLPLFPFAVGAYGTGANFALRRSAALAMGGFDTAFGVGTRTGGGEDLDAFTRVLLRGGAVVVEPSAVVWHRHRADLAGLERQAWGYGVGLGAWLTKIAINPRTLAMALIRAPRAVARIIEMRRTVPVRSAVPGIPEPFASDVFADIRSATERLAHYEQRCVGRGPLAFVQQRLAGARAMRPI